MDSNISNRDAKKAATTTPVYRGVSRSVYRSLAAEPVPLSVHRDAATGLERPFSKLNGPQTKSPGDVVWSEQKHTKSGAAELLPCPIPLIVANAPHQSLFVESNPVTKVVSAVHELLQQHEVDSVYNSSKFKWKCSCYAGHAETRFVARLFSVPDKTGFFVLDFQRRGGDAFHFQSLYKAMHFRLLKTGFVVCNDPKSEQKFADAPVIRTFKPLPLPQDLLRDMDSQAPVDLEPIYRMCNSQYIDVQREGLAALSAQVAESAAARQAATGISGRLVELISLSRDSQVRRLAVTALAHISSLAQAHQVIADKSSVLVLAKLVTNEDESAETRRQACSTLAALPRTALDQTVLATLKSVQTAADPRLAQLAQSFSA